MSAPRRHYGPKPPGRLQATLLKVAAAELTDGARLGRGKHYFADDAVTDVIIEPGIAEVWVQGSRPEPYLVTITATPGVGVPTAADIRAACTCPDSEQGAFCKHCVAGIFAIANEVSIEPGLIELWRQPNPRLAVPSRRPVETRSSQPGNRDPGDDDPGDDDPGDDDPGDDGIIAAINAMLTGHQPSGVPALAGESAPHSDDLGVVPPMRHRTTHDPVVDRLLASALDELDLNWH